MGNGSANSKLGLVWAFERVHSQGGEKKRTTSPPTAGSAEGTLDIVLHFSFFFIISQEKVEDQRKGLQTGT